MPGSQVNGVVSRLQLVRGAAQGSGRIRRKKTGHLTPIAAWVLPGIPAEPINPFPERSRRERTGWLSGDEYGTSGLPKTLSVF